MVIFACVLAYLVSCAVVAAIVSALDLFDDSDIRIAGFSLGWPISVPIMIVIYIIAVGIVLGKEMRSK